MGQHFSCIWFFLLKYSCNAFQEYNRSHGRNKSSRWKEKIKLTSQNSTRQTRQCITTQSRLSGPSLREKKVFLINIYLLEDQYFFLPSLFLSLSFLSHFASWFFPRWKTTSPLLIPISLGNFELQKKALARIYPSVSMRQSPLASAETRIPVIFCVERIRFSAEEMKKRQMLTSSQTNTVIDYNVCYGCSGKTNENPKHVKKERLPVIGFTNWKMSAQQRTIEINFGQSQAKKC